MGTITLQRTYATDYAGASCGISASLSIPSITVTGSTFSIPQSSATITNWLYNPNAYPQARYQRPTSVMFFLKIGSSSSGSLTAENNNTVTIPTGSGWASSSWSQTVSSSSSLTTSNFFKSANYTERTLYLTVETTSCEIDIPDYSGVVVFGHEASLISGTVPVTLDAPPTVSSATGSYATPQYAGLGAYTATLSTIKAQFGGKIQTITLTIGSDSETHNFSSTTVSSDSISITPSVAGTYTPIITIEDSRGQIKTITLPQIVVNPYLNPSLGFDVVRTNNNGVKADEGAYGLIMANVSFTDAVANLVQPTVKINGATSSNVTWYLAYNASTGVSNTISDWSTISSGDTIYGLINGSFAQTDSYQITVILKDSLEGNSSAITQTLSTAFYTIDFQAGGKEIAFGGPANDILTTNQQDVGLFKCEMESQFNNISQFNSKVIFTNLIGEIKMYSGLTIPTGWLLCDGSEVLIEDYPLLNNALGGDSDNDAAATLWGTASDSDHFVLPNFVGRMPLGASDINTTEWITITGENEFSTFTLAAPTYARWGTGDTWLYKILEPGDYLPTYTNMNELFGGDPASGVAKCLQVALNVASNGGYSWWRPSPNDMPTHLHSQPSHSHFSGLYTVPDRFGSGSRDAAGAYTGYSGQVAINTGGAAPNTNNAGGGRYISQMPPFAVVNYIICAV